MINKNSSGNNLNANYGTTVQADSRSFLAKFLLNGTELSCDIKKFQVSKGACGTNEGFQIGGVISSILTAEVFGLSTNIKTEEIEVRVGLNISGSYEWVTLGFFTITDVSKTTYSTSITGYGKTVSKTLDAFVPPQTKSLANIASSIATTVGCTVSFDTGITTSYEVDDLLLDLNCYQALQMLASLVGGYATDTYDGNIAIHKFDDTSTLAVSAGLMTTLPIFEEQDFEITGVVVTVTPETTDEDGNIVPATQFPTTPTGLENLMVEDKYMSEDIYDNVFSPNLVGYQYRPATVNLSLGDPRIEGNDVLSVADVNGNTFIVPCHMVTHAYDGGFSTTVQAVKATVQENGIATSAPITAQINQINIATVQAQNSAQSAYDSAVSASGSAQQALQYATQAEQLANQAYENADIAQTSATIAYNSATSAQLQLSEVENVLGTVNWIAQHGQYVLTADQTPVEGKVYYTEDNGQYVPVSDVADDPQTAGYYELQIDSAVSNYIASHLALTNDGLFVMTDNSDYKMQVASDGIYLWNANGIVASYTTSVTLGDLSGMHIVLSAGRLGFWQGNSEVAYISTDKLFISDAEITNSLRLGNFIWKPRSGRLTLMYSPVS